MAWSKADAPPDVILATEFGSPLESREVATATKPRYVDTSNSALAIDCPRCGLVTSRFLEFCRNCSYQLWPSSVVATAAFTAWREADPARRRARQYDLTILGDDGPVLVDFEARAHKLGIHLFPPSNWPFVICVGMLLLGMAAIPFGNPTRLILAIIGAVIFLVGVVGWVIIEDVKMYDDVATHDPEPAETHSVNPEHQNH